MGTEAAAMAKEAENANEIIHYFAQEWAPGSKWLAKRNGVFY